MSASRAQPPATTGRDLDRALAASAAPSELITATPVNPDPTQADRQRRTEIDRAWSAYRGEFPDVFKTPHGQPSDNVRPNRCAAIVDKGVAWLFGHEFQLTVRPADEDGMGDDDMDDDDADASQPKRPAPKKGKSTKQGKPGRKQQDPMEAALCRVWGSEDDMLTTLTMAAMNGGVSGHVFLKIIWDSAKMRYPRVSVLDSHNIYVVSDPDDCNRAVCYVIEYTAKLGITSSGQQRNVTKRQVIALVDPDGNARYGVGGEDDDDYWTITNWLRYDDAGGNLGNAPASALSAQQQPWLQVGASIEWRYPFPPIVDAMNLPNPNEFWGLPDLPPALIDLNERIHFIESNIAKIIKSNAHPWVFASGCDPSAIRNEPGVVQGLPSTDSKVWAVSASGDLASSMAFASDLRADMDEQSRVPAVALGRQADMPKGNMSGIAIQLLFQPLIEKTDLKRRLYGQLIRRVSAYVLVLLGQIADWRDVEIDIEWPDLLPNDDLAMAQTAVAEQTLGVSQRTLLKQLGYDPDEEADYKQEEQQRQLDAMTKGQGMPPAPRPQPGQQQSQQSGASGNGGLDPSNPAAQAAQQRASAVMKAAFGKTNTTGKTGKTGPNA